MRRDYDLIAGVFDSLQVLVFGNRLLQAQRFLVQAIPPDVKVLILGGGTGAILEEIAAVHPGGLHITYVDISAKMMGRAKRRNAANNLVVFVQSDIAAAQLAPGFDVVITPFFFDNFRDERVDSIIAGIAPLLHSGAKWLHCDFQNMSGAGPRLLLSVMYFFFRLACGIEASRLPDTRSCLAARGFRLAARKSLLSGFVVSEIYDYDSGVYLE